MTRTWPSKMANTAKDAGSRKPLQSPKMTYWMGAQWMHQDIPTQFGQQVLLLLVKTPLRLLKRLIDKIHTFSWLEKSENHTPTSTEVRRTEQTLSHVPQRTPPHPRPRTKIKDDHVSSFTTVPHTPPSTQTIALLLLPFRAPQTSQKKGSLDEATLAVSPLEEPRMVSVNVHSTSASGVKQSSGISLVAQW